MVDLGIDQSSVHLRAYVDEVGRTDIQRLADIRHNPDVIRRLIAAIARSVASDVVFTTLTADVRVVAPSINAETVSTYVGLLERMFIVEAQQPWTPALRSRPARLRTAAKLHLVDPALAAAVLGAGARQLRIDPATLGLVFESAVIHPAGHRSTFGRARDNRCPTPDVSPTSPANVQHPAEIGERLVHEGNKVNADPVCETALCRDVTSDVVDHCVKG